MPKYLVEAISQYRMVYVIETENANWAEDTVAAEEAEEFGQQWLGETILSSREIDDAEAIRVHDEMNDYLKSWTPEMKLARIHKVVKE
jgi:hypothetical protein